MIEPWPRGRVDVLTALEGVVGNRYLFGPQKRPAPKGMVPVEGWRDLLFILDAG